MDLAIAIVPLTVFLSVTLLAVGMASMGQQTRMVRERLERYSSPAVSERASASAAAVMRDQRLSSVSSLDQLLRHLRLAEGIALDLARAALPLKVGEYILLRLLCGMVVALAPIAAGLPMPLGIMVGIGGYFIPRIYVKNRQKKRRQALNDQLVDVTTMIANSLKSGYSFVQGLELVARELPKPVSEEIAQVLMEMNMGTKAEEALTNLCKRVGSYDLDLIVTAMLIQRQAGGNLGEVLEKIGNTIRARVQMLREVESLTSEVKLSAYTVGLLPIFLLVVLSVVSRSYVMDLIGNPLGQMLLGTATVMEVIGFVVLRRMTAIEV